MSLQMLVQVVVVPATQDGLPQVVAKLEQLWRGGVLAGVGDPESPRSTLR